MRWNSYLGLLLAATVLVSGCSGSDGTSDAVPSGADVMASDGTCTPDCLGKACGDDGCGGNCGDCAKGEECTAYGSCACTPACDGKICGTDGCGGSCGDCGVGHICDDGGCVVCVPDCAGLDCGDNGCGGSCGDCPLGLCKKGACTIECDFLCDDLECGTAGPADECDCGKCKADFGCEEGLCTEVICEPDCAGKECGPDGCDGNCGECPEEKPICNADFNCIVDCTPDCADKECGDDDCDGSCGECEEGSICQEGTCGEPPCEPACADLECGDDGCDGSCGECANDKPYCTEGLCTDVCPTDCTGLDCGDDGCGGSCGECEDALVCAVGACVEEGTPTVTITDPTNNAQTNLLVPKTPVAISLAIQGWAYPLAGHGVQVFLDQEHIATVEDTANYTVPDVPLGVHVIGIQLAELDEENWGPLQNQEARDWVKVHVVGECEGAADVAACDDQNPCSSDACLTGLGQCGYGFKPGCCISDLECDIDWSCAENVCTENPCQPACADKDCGDDGCGGSCGECGNGEECIDGTCTNTYTCSDILACATGCNFSEQCITQCFEDASEASQGVFSELALCIVIVCGQNVDVPCFLEATQGTCAGQMAACGAD